jgi:cobalt-zinc-cadmium resistance protein CzcA
MGDFTFFASQGLGNLAADRQRKELANEQIQLARRESALLEYELIYRVEKTWHQWRYAELHLQKLLELSVLYDSLRQRTGEQFRQGAISRLEQSLVDNQYVQLQQRILRARAEQTQAKAQLMKAAWLQGGDFTAGTALLELPYPFSTQVNPLLQSVAEQRVNTARAERILSEKAFAPEMTLGLFHQSIRPTYPLFGVEFGVQIPLFRKAGNSRIQSLQLQQLALQNERQQIWQERQVEWTAQRQVVQQHKVVLDASGQELLNGANTLRDLARQQLEAGAIDYFRFLQAMDTALQNELEYLHLLNQYNQAVLYYNFLTQ